MRESFLHFIWQFQKFDTISLSTADDLAVQIYAVGQYNTEAGPDFMNAKLLIDDITWYGHVELHLRSSDWNKHKHQHDKSYNNVVLHVVWEDDVPVKSADGQLIPVVELKNRIKPDLLKKCNLLIKSPDRIACESQFHKVKDIDKWSMLSQVGVQRLKDKSAIVLAYLKLNKGDWDQTTYQLLARNFGFKTNEHPFLKLAQALPYKVLVKHAHKTFQMEALLFGMSGLLTSSDDDYSRSLSKEFDYLKKKYQLAGKGLIDVEWKFLRMRPGNFPTVRLAEFAAFMSDNIRCFDHFIHFDSVKELKDRFKLKLSPYWKKHYKFGKQSARSLSGIGSGSVEVLLINTVAPLLAAYAQYTDEQKYMDQAVDLLQALKPEKNHITRRWEALSIDAKDAFDSQSIISLNNEFCLKKKCLSCKIGVNLING